ncbi:MAG: GMP/IMP nucleotidase [Gammaproteobacteria bacterium]|nr:MAG: GMP/IMP nucleotidase [Gammaproteobacteria bacterium]
MIDWQQVKTVFLDMDGTLLDLYFDNHFWLEFVPRRYAEKHLIPLQQAHDLLIDKYKAVEGTMAWYCVDYWSEQLQLDIEGLKRETSHLINVHPHVIEFLRRLQQTHHRVVLVTNAHQKSLMLKMEKTALHDYLDKIICSHDIGLPKENPDFWKKLQDTESYEPSATLLVDDSLSVLHSARQYGIAWLLAITRPDSRQEERIVNEFESVTSFAELISELTTDN